MNQVFIVSAVRTPIGSFGGSLSGLSATALGAIAAKEAVKRAGIQAKEIQEVIMGNVYSANLGQAPANQVAVFSGLPPVVPCTTVNKVCASGMKAVMLGAQSIMSGANDVVLAGGMESMSNVPFYLDKARNGYRLGHGQLTDGLIKDGLWDVYNDYHMGSAAELCAREMKISREDQDAFAVESYKRSASSHQGKLIESEIVPVEIQVKGKDSFFVKDDEEYLKVNFDKIPSLKPVFDKAGTVTAANASKLNDGASCLILVSEKKMKELNLKPLARVVGFADSQQAPEWFTTTPSKAIPKALAVGGLKTGDVDFFEINEAFSVVSLANNRLLDLDPARVNVYGGAVSIGHPLGNSGSRILVTLLNVLEKNGKKIGAAGICNGGGGASAFVLEKL